MKVIGKRLSLGKSDVGKHVLVVAHVLKSGRQVSVSLSLTSIRASVAGNYIT